MNKSKELCSLQKSRSVSKTRAISEEVVCLLFFLWWFSQKSFFFLFLSALSKLTDACAIMYEQALVHAPLKNHLDKMLGRAERLKSEILWQKRENVQVRVCYDSSGPLSPSRETEEPKGVGKFVTKEESSLVDALMVLLQTACIDDATCARNPELPTAQLVDCWQRLDLADLTALVHYPHVFRHMRVVTFGLSLADSIGRYCLDFELGIAFFEML